MMTTIEISQTQIKQLMIMVLCAVNMGVYYNQSGSNFPKYKFVSSILVATKNNGSDYSGMLLCILFGVVSRRSQTIIGSRGLSIAMINKWIYTVQLILMMEEFLKHSIPTKNQLKMLKKNCHSYSYQHNQ